MDIKGIRESLREKEGLVYFTFTDRSFFFFSPPFSFSTLFFFPFFFFFLLGIGCPHLCVALDAASLIRTSRRRTAPMSRRSGDVVGTRARRHGPFQGGIDLETISHACIVFITTSDVITSISMKAMTNCNPMPNVVDFSYLCISLIALDCVCRSF